MVEFSEKHQEASKMGDRRWEIGVISDRGLGNARRGAWREAAETGDNRPYQAVD